MGSKRGAVTADASSPTGEAEWQRARRPEQKEERRKAILRAALDLVDEVGVDGTTLSEIARRAGLSKANCYRYFESREAILLALALEEVSGWMAAIHADLEPLADTGDAEAVAEAFVRATLARPRLCTLFSSISSVLERNVSVDVVADFKQAFNADVFGSSQAIAGALPPLSPDDADQFVLFLGFFIAGAWPSANPPPAVLEFFERSGTERNLDFSTALRAHTRAILRGLLAERTR